MTDTQVKKISQIKYTGQIWICGNYNEDGSIDQKSISEPQHTLPEDCDWIAKWSKNFYGYILYVEQ